MKEATDNNFPEIKQLIEGKRIISIERRPDSKSQFPMWENATTLIMEDGTIIRFSGWGYDSCGLDIEIEEAIKQV